MDSKPSIGWLLTLLMSLMAAQAQTCHSGQQEGRYLTPDPSDCSRYFHCSVGVSTPQLMACSVGTLFDVTTSRCQHAQSVDCGTRPRPLRQPRPVVRADIPLQVTAPPITVYEVSMIGSLTVSTIDVTSCASLLANLNTLVQRWCSALNARCSTPQINCQVAVSPLTSRPLPALRSFWNYQ
ncbi:uncharacterized protein LOC112557243 [Pomacea canaliculata]|uniref:uncharacterized protein LOC112557243 n=1 Tax=Pomacea canaliculata TaxID=400727 RepID=UPI000D72A3DE|nr:uncharacterized protein LOC112557243 [Pomacea canaliculata]